LSRVQIFDMMGYEPSHWNKINIHVGGALHRAAKPGLTTTLAVNSNRPDSAESSVLSATP
jgi:hypothetical protein